MATTRIKAGNSVRFTDDSGERVTGVVNGFNSTSGEAYVEVPGTPEGPNQEHEVPLDELELVR